MARKFFFSFHFGRDAWRAGQVRNSDLIPNEDEYGFIDAADWEEVKMKGEETIKQWINSQLENTSVTVVLIGAETSKRPWVNYEIKESWERGNALIGLRVHNVKDQDAKTDIIGINPLDTTYLVNGANLSSLCKTYDWVSDDGRNNLGTWVEDAFKTRESYKGETELKNNDANKESIKNKTRTQPLIPATGPVIINR